MLEKAVYSSNKSVILTQKLKDYPEFDIKIQFFKQI